VEILVLHVRLLKFEVRSRIVTAGSPGVDGSDWAGLQQDM